MTVAVASVNNKRNDKKPPRSIAGEGGGNNSFIVTAPPEVINEQKEMVKSFAEMLGDTPPRLEVDFAVPNSYHTSSIILKSDTRAALEAYCRKENISLFSLALGVMQQAIRAYSHESFAIGTAYDSRPPQFHDTIGMFVNTVLIPFAKGAEGGKETLKKLNDRWRNDILPLATAPFDMLSSEGYGCNLCLAFNVGIIEASNSAPKMQPVPKLEGGNSDVTRAKFDLTVAWMECSSADGSVEVSFESGIGPWPGIEDRFNQIITQILNTSASSPSSSLVIDNILPFERAQVLEWGTGSKDAVRDCCLHELVEEQARIRPDAVALMNNCGGDKMTYRELNTKADRLAVELQKRGAKPNTFVGILMGTEKTFEMCVAVLGVLKSGAAYVPMDAVLFPPERIKFIAEDTNMKFIVTVGEYVNVVEGEFEMMLVKEAMEKRSNDEVVLERDVKPTDCAYMIYTSGTTGTPKGVLCHHLGPVNMMYYDSGIEVFSGGVPGDDIVGCAAPHIFDMFVYGYFGTLGNGLTLTLDMKCCTILECTPSMAEIYLRDKTNDIKIMLVGGEACIQGLETRAYRFINGYGPTEASIFATASDKSGTIGFPLPNTLCYVVHPDDGTLCPPGVSGELWVGGIGVGIGYHNRPELTAEKFIPNHFEQSGRVYKTGDRVKWNEDGELVYLGRFDHQVKVRGYRIELGEIQAELEKQEGVNGALVMVHDENLVAFVSSGMSDSSENHALAEYIMDVLKSDSCRLPSYMVPKKILILEEFPLTQNGKIDRKLLMSQFADVHVGPRTEYVAPATEEEKEMIKQWQAVLGADRMIGMNDDFFDIGGHSILAMALAAALDCDVRLISSHPTPALLLAHLQSMEGVSSRIDYSSLNEVDTLTRTEQRMVFIQLNNPEDTTYNIPFCVQFDGHIDLLANAATVVDALSILRTRFVNGKAIEDAKVSVNDLTEADTSEIQSILYSHFDMTEGPLCRFGVDKKTNMLYGNIHHSIADGRSLQILFEAIAAGEVKNETRDGSIRKYAASESLQEVVDKQQEMVKSFVEMLGDTPPRLEVDFAVHDSYHTSSIILNSDTRAALEAYCRKENISLFSLALGVMQQAIRAYSHESFAIGTAYNSRPPQFHDTIGMFVNTVLIPFAKGAEGGKETLKKLNDRWRNDILPLATAPFDMLSSEGYGCNLCLAFNVGIIEASHTAPKMQPLPKLEEENGLRAPAAMFDLLVEWIDCSSGDGSVEVSFESGIGPWPGIEDRFNQIITHILHTNTSSSPSSSLAIDNILPPERAQVLEWGTGAKDAVRDCCLHELVEEQARIRPDAVALMNNCGGDKMTYRELNTKADRLAVELQKRGAKPNTFVGILMGTEKTFEMCVAVLGVLKSGAAYVPMDAVLFPPERIKFIAEDTNMKFIVTVGEYVNVVEGEFEMMLVEEAMEKRSNDEAVLERDVKPEDCAYMIYTSGTTGTPKGVVCNHFGPVNMMFNEAGMKAFSHRGIPGDDVVGVAPPLIFDFFAYGYFFTLGSGFSLSLDMKFFSMFIGTPSVAEFHLRDTKTKLKAMLVGGEACIQGLESKVEKMTNIYGPTESSMICTASNTSDTIGNPLPNTLCYVVHPDDGTLCPPGVSGELWVGGIGVGIGYHNRPELTAEKFIPNHFEQSGRVYKTGDRVKWNEDGELVYLGRFDHQVKVRGYRIELGEIQAELEKQEGVNGALVVVHDENLVAFVASGMSDSSDNDALVEYIMDVLKSDSCRLPSYMVPKKILILEEFPLTQNGKIDRKLLMSQFADVHVGPRTEYVAPATEEEKEMIKQWQAVLGADRMIGMNDDFFDIGGHSILAMALAAALDCDVRLISSHPTPALLLARLQSMEGASSRIDYSPLVEVDSLTKTEQRMVFIQLNNPEETTYNIPFCVQFDGHIDLLANTETVVDALPILRTRFVNGKAVEDAKVSVNDLTDADTSEIQSILYCNFDMEEGPLCRFGVDKKTNMLYGNIHHSIADGRSLQILFEAIAAGEVKNETRDWSIRKYAASESLQEVINKQKEMVKSFVEMLGDTPPRLEVDFAVPNSYHTSSIILNSDTRAALEAYCRKENISLFSLALGVMQQAIRAYSHESFAIGTAYDSRPPQFYDTIGMFVNTVLIPFAKGAEGGKETLKKLNDRWRNDILPLATAPFDMLSSEGYGCNLCLAFNVGIIEASNSAPKMQPVPKLEGGNSDVTRAKFDLTVAWMECSSADGSVEVSFESGIGPWPGIEDRFNQIITHILNTSASSPSSSLVIDNILPFERAQVLEWGTGSKDAVRDCCLHELVEEQARIRPDAVALMNNCGGDKMTYRELNTKADRLAVELQKRGAKPNTFVGILMGTEKTFEMCVAVLGVLKSGAAYVPMDAVLFPPERIKFIAEDTNMKFIVTVGEYANVVEGEFEMMLVKEAMEKRSNDEAVLERDVKPEDCAYMIYTSGTTGTPKGVLCHHLGPVNMMYYDSGIEVFSGGVPGDDIVGCAAPHIFDMFVYGYFGTLGLGLTLTLDMKCCTILECTPSMAEIYLRDKTNDIKIMLVGGEACIQGLETRAYRFINGYGPTEASIFATASDKSGTIGFPLPNTLCYVVHPDDGTLCPPGVSGELWVGGIGVGIGYHNRPELTAEKFIPNHFEQSGRVYKTGDRVKWNEDGELVYLGRFDHQVKVRGYRIELGEIQAELEKQEGVNGALVVVHDENLVAFVASGMSGSSENDALVEYVMGELKSDSCRLPSYMVPWKILALEEFPLTQNGKIDRKLLIGQLQQELFRVSLLASFNAAETITQQFLCKLFEEVLNVDAIGIDCDFMERGGHSLLVMQAVSRIREEFDIDSFTVRHFIELKTARNIGQKIDEMMNKNRHGKGTRRSFAFSLQSINSVVGSAVSRDDHLLSKLIIKAVAVLVLFVSSWVAILPSNFLLSRALHMRGQFSDGIGIKAADEELGSFTAAIGVMIAAYLAFFVCLAIQSRIYGYLLRKAIGKGPATIKRSSVTFGLWYVFDRIWFMTRMIGSGLFHGTIFHTWFYKVYGADIGKNNFFEGTDVRLPFMLTTGDNVVVEAGAKLETVVIKKNGDVAVDELVVGDDTVVGPNTHIGLGAKIGASCTIKSLSLVQRGRKIPDATIIEGHEMTDLNQTDEGPERKVEDQVVVSAGWHLAFLLMSFIPAMMFILISVLVIFSFSLLPYTLELFVSLYPICMTVGQIFVAICMLPIRSLLVVGHAKTEWEKVNSKSFLRRQLATSLYHSSLNILDGTIVYHLVSRFIFGAEIDVKSSFTPRVDEPDLTSVGDCVFGANGVLLRNTLFYPGGIVRYGKVDVSDQAMILDRAVVSPDTALKEKVTVAPLTAVYDDTIHEEGTVLLGTPALNLNRKTEDVEMEITSEPLVHLLLQYFIFIYFKYIVLIFTLSAFYANGVVFWRFFYCECYLGKGGAIGISFLILPLSLLVLVIGCLTLSLAIKWMVIGDFKRFQSKGLIPVDSWEAFRWMIANQLIHTATPFVLQLIDEFWLTATFWKMMGAKIGTNTRIDPDVLLLEVDLLEIGDNCRIEEEATLFCHRFNEGGLKLERIVIPSNSYIQNRAVIFPGSEVSEEHVTMLPLTPLNPGEKLTAGHWQGSPAERVSIKTGKILPMAHQTRRSTMLSERTSISVNSIV